jgi:tetratricopeptide (TPR) repeat protein
MHPFALILTAALSAVTPSPAAKTALERADKALENNQLDAAVAAYRDALTATPNWSAALNGLGTALFKQDKRDQAIAQYKAAVEADPTFATAWYNLGKASRKTSDFATAVNAYEKYTKLDPKDADGFYGLGESYRQLGGENAKAIAAYEKFLKMETRASEQKYIDKAKEAIASLKTAAAVPVAAAAPAPTPAPAAPVAAPVVAAPPAEAIPSAAAKKVGEGDRLMGEKKYREASFAYQDAVNADPKNVEALFKLGNTLAVLGYYSQAIDKWNVVQQASTDPTIKKSAVDNIAKAQAKMAQVGGGSPQAQGKPPGAGPVADSTRAQARAYYEQGVKQIGARDYGNALASLSACLQLEPALSVGYVARGSALIGLRRFAEAAVDYQYALRLDPNLGSPLYGLAESYRGMNRPSDAKTYYERYVASSSSDVRPELQTDARGKIEQLRAP